MPGVHRESRPEATVTSQDVEECRHALQLFHELSKTCQGPRGKVKFIQNSIGGCITVTSSSKRLFSCVSIRTPILKFLTSSVQSHLSSFGDGGLFCASLASSLIKSGYDSEINCQILSEIFETFLTLCMEFFNSVQCHYRYSANLADINCMSSFVGSILRTKPLCRLNCENHKYLTVLILECFLNSVTERDTGAPSENVFVTTAHAESVQHSSVFPGILVIATEFSKFKTATFSLTKATHVNGKPALKVALITASMSGDLEELANMKFNTTGTDVEISVIDELFQVCNRLVKCDIGLVLCQKVIHPGLKKHLQSEGVLVVDRIGLQPIRYISKLSGATSIGCLDSDIEDVQYGWIDDVKHVILCGQSYIHLIKGNNPVTTLLLTHQQEQPLNEIKEMIYSAMISLDQLLHEPAVLCGGGCWQAGLVDHLKTKLQEDGEAFADLLDIPRCTVDNACSLFTTAILHSSVQWDTQVLFNYTNGHLYNKTQVKNKSGHKNVGEINCCCGLARLSEDDSISELRAGQIDSVDTLPSVKYKPGHSADQRVLWDGLSVRRNAFQMAVLSACAALRIGQVLK